MSSPILFGSPLALNLQPGIQPQDSSGNPLSSIQSGTVNPTVTATAGVPGSIYQNSSTGVIYIKQDSGVSTNWSVGVNTTTLPTVQVFTSGSGSYTPSSPLVIYARVRAIGGGGGGGGGGASGGSSGGSGGNTTFGSFLTAGGGGGGAACGSGNGGSGGSASLTTSSTVLQIAALAGGSGLGYDYTTSSAGDIAGPPGASSPFGGAGVGQNQTTPTAAVSNTGSGGAGGSSAYAVNTFTGSAGGAGAYVEAIILGPNSIAPISYSIGSAGTAGSAGSSGFVGGVAGSGILIIEEYYGVIGASSSSGITRSTSVYTINSTLGSAASTDYVAIVTTSGITITLPTAVSNLNQYEIINASGGTIYIATTSGQTISGSSSPISLVPISASAQPALTILSDNTNWRIS